MALVQVPGLGLFKGSLGSGKDVAIGAALGLVGVGGVRYMFNKLTPETKAKIPATVVRFLPAISGALTAALLYKLGKGKGKSWAAGAVLVGVAVNAWDEVRAKYPSLADLVSVRLSAYNGMLVRDQGGMMNGMLVNDSVHNLNELQQINMTHDED